MHTSYWKEDFSLKGRENVDEILADAYQLENDVSDVRTHKEIDCLFCTFQQVMVSPVLFIRPAIN